MSDGYMTIAEVGQKWSADRAELKRFRTQLGCVKALATLWEEEAADFTRVSAQSGGSTALDVRAEANQIHAAALREMLAD